LKRGAKQKGQSGEIWVMEEKEIGTNFTKRIGNTDRTLGNWKHIVREKVS